jgi:dienelactone hydrolase
MASTCRIAAFALLFVVVAFARGADATIPFAVDHDAPLEPAERVESETDAYTRLRVEFNGIRKDRVSAFLYLPKSKQSATTRPAVLLQYGIGGSKKTNYIVALGEQCAARGFVVLTIDAPMKGERKPPRDKRRLLDSFGEQGRFPWYLGDYSRAIDYLVTRPEVDRDRVGYVGISWGAITGITFVAHEPRVRAMASICAGGNFLGTLDRATVTEESKRAAQRIDPVYHVAQIAPRPLLLLNVTHDQLVPQFYAEALHKAAGDAPSVTKQWIDSDHFFNGVDRLAVMARVVDFMQKSLAQPAPSPPAP